MGSRQGRNLIILVLLALVTGARPNTSDFHRVRPLICAPNSRLARHPSNVTLPARPVGLCERAGQVLLR